MKISLRRLICFLLLGLLAVTLFATCNTVSNTRVTNDQPQVDNCRVIQHESGETCVPLKPQRIVALRPDTTLDPLVALGIKPVGYTSYNWV